MPERFHRLAWGIAPSESAPSPVRQCSSAPRVRKRPVPELPAPPAVWHLGWRFGGWLHLPVESRRVAGRPGIQPIAVEDAEARRRGAVLWFLGSACSATIICPAHQCRKRGCCSSPGGSNCSTPPLPCASTALQVKGLEFNGFSPNLLASGAADGELCIWDIAAPAQPSLYPSLKVRGAGVAGGCVATSA